LANRGRTEPERPAGPQLMAWAAAVGLFGVGVALFLTPHDWATLFQRDLKVYQAAIDAFAGGGDPYRPAQTGHARGLFFTAPPFVWLLFKTAAHSALKPVFGSVLLAADAISITALPVILSRLFLGPGVGRIALGAAFFFTAFDGAGFFTGLVINNGTPLYALIAVALVPAVTRGKWLGFHIAVALATAFKPFYAAFWLVPLLAEGPGARQWAASAAGLAVAAATYIAPVFTAPKLMAAWLHALARQTVGQGLLGDNLLGAVASQPAARHSPLAPYEAQLALSAVLVGAALMLGRIERPRRIAALVLIAVFLNPRAMRYDLSTAAIPLLAVAAGALSRDPPGPTAQALWAVVLAGAMILFSHNDARDGFLYAGIAVAALLVAAAASFAGSPARGR
jgi:hypothetical protein